ncbi:MAG TPA: hypothetical protein GXZ26_02470 [Firmicutes bacterium]|jgi:hypothetical protein|nr:hypothetical protein [Bacillota bacterium]
MKEKNRAPGIPPAVAWNFFGLNLLLILVFFFAFLGWKYFHGPKAVTATTATGAKASGLWEISSRTAKNLLDQGLPLLRFRHPSSK